MTALEQISRFIKTFNLVDEKAFAPTVQELGNLQNKSIEIVSNNLSNLAVTARLLEIATLGIFTNYDSFLPHQKLALQMLFSADNKDFLTSLDNDQKTVIPLLQQQLKVDKNALEEKSSFFGSIYELSILSTKFLTVLRTNAPKTNTKILPSATLPESQEFIDVDTEEEEVKETKDITEKICIGSSGVGPCTIYVLLGKNSVGNTQVRVVHSSSGILQFYEESRKKLIADGYDNDIKVYIAGGQFCTIDEVFDLATRALQDGDLAGAQVLCCDYRQYMSLIVSVTAGEIVPQYILESDDVLSPEEPEKVSDKLAEQKLALAQTAVPPISFWPASLPVSPPSPPKRKQPEKPEEMDPPPPPKCQDNHDNGTPTV